MRHKPHSTPKPSPASPLDARKRALAEEQEKLQLEIARRQKLIADAPRIAEEATRRRREELILRKSRTEARLRSQVALNDPRHEHQLQANVATRPKTLRKERNQGMLTFFVLLAVLACVLFWLYLKVIQAS